MDGYKTVQSDVTAVRNVLWNQVEQIVKAVYFYFVLDSETGNQDKRKSPSTTQETTPNTAPVQVSALNSLCSAYASDSDDNEEISGTNSQKI